MLIAGTVSAQVGDVLMIDLGKVQGNTPDALLSAFKRAGGVAAANSVGEVALGVEQNGIPVSIKATEAGAPLHSYTGMRVRILSCDVYLYSEDGAGPGGRITAVWLVQGMRDPQNRTAGEALKDLEAFYLHWLKFGARGVSMGSVIQPEVVESAVAYDEGQGAGSLLGMSLDS